MRFREQTNDHGIERVVSARDNFAEYIITSSYAKDMYNRYFERHQKRPSAKWLNANITFKRVK